MMKTKLFYSVVLVLALISSAIASEMKPGEVLTKPSPKVQKLINKYKLEVVDYKYTKKAIGKGTRKGAKALLIDARPNKKYMTGTIPSSISIPDTEFDKYFPQIKDVPKNKEVIVFCGGWKCGKSPKTANMLKKKGFTNVKLYQAGEPEWKKKTYSEVDTPIVKSAQKKNNAVIIDARPYKKYLQSTIPGAIAIPDTQVDKLVGKFPADKNIKVITFCGGYHCGKSHKVAKKMLSMGYTNVVVYAGGLPKWKKDGMATTGSAGKKAPAKAVAKKAGMKNGVKLGADEGTVDGETFKKMIETNQVPANVQIVDVFPPEDFKTGHLPNAINVYAEPLKAKDLMAKLPKDKMIVFNCASGARALEAWTKLKEAKLDISNVYYFDANISCKGQKCTIEANEPLD